MNAADLRPLSAAVLEALAPLPNGRSLSNGLSLPEYRQHLMASDRRFREVMTRVEAMGLPAASLAELWLWLAHLVLDTGSRPSTTGQSYARTVSRFLKWAADEGVNFREAKLADFERWTRWLAIACRNGATWRKQQIMALRNFYDWRRSRGLAESNPTADLRHPRSKPKPAKKYTTEHLRALFRAIDQGVPRSQRRDRAIVLLLLTTGLRREELASLRLADIEFSGRRGVVRVNGKGAKERDVPFEGPVVQTLGDWLEQRQGLPFDFDPDALFVAFAGPNRGAQLTVDGHEALLGKYARAAKLREWGIHRFRVTFATQLYDDGADIETIRALMGHESIETTRRYLAVSERARKTRLNADRQHSVLGTKPTGTPLWARLAAGEITRD